MSRAQFFHALGGNRALIWLTRQAYRYVHEPDTKQQVQQILVNAMDRAQPRVVIGHSLGSVVAYETLCVHPEWSIDTLVTLGSPLGMPSFYNYLEPRPVDGKGVWPNVRRWVNVADDGDPVALIKELQGLFAVSPAGAAIEDRRVSNGFWSHDTGRYLNTPQVGEAVGNAF